MSCMAPHLLPSVALIPVARVQVPLRSTGCLSSAVTLSLSIPVCCQCGLRLRVWLDKRLATFLIHLPLSLARLPLLVNGGSAWAKAGVTFLSLHVCFLKLPSGNQTRAEKEFALPCRLFPTLADK